MNYCDPGQAFPRQQRNPPQKSPHRDIVFFTYHGFATAVVSGGQQQTQRVGGSPHNYRNDLTTTRCIAYNISDTMMVSAYDGKVDLSTFWDRFSSRFAILFPLFLHPEEIRVIFFFFLILRLRMLCPAFVRQFYSSQKIIYPYGDLIILSGVFEPTDNMYTNSLTVWTGFSKESERGKRHRDTEKTISFFFFFNSIFPPHIFKKDGTTWSFEGTTI